MNEAGLSLLINLLTSYLRLILILRIREQTTIYSKKELLQHKIGPVAFDEE